MPSHHELSTTIDLTAPIPELAPIEGWKEVPIHKAEHSDEPLVPVGIFSKYNRVLTSSVYADEHHNSPYDGGLDGSNIALFMREGVAEKLDQIAQLLPRGMHLMVMDAYRTLEVQAALFEQYKNKLQEQHPDWPEEQLSAETQEYVSIPSTDPTRPSPHNTGGSVDVVIVHVDEVTQKRIDTIDFILANPHKSWESEFLHEMSRSKLIRDNAKMLDFGTRFDHGGPAAGLRYLEELSEQRELSDTEKAQLENRRLLFNAMTAAGMVGYEKEWWHFNDPASQMGAKVSGLEFAEYGAMELSPENIEFAQMRNLHHERSVRLARGEEWIPPKGLEVHYALARHAVQGNDPRNVTNLEDEVDQIQPPDAA